MLLADDVWGKRKTIDYVAKLSQQIAGLIRCGEAERIATGEYLALVMDCTGQDALQWQAKGAPLAQMMPLDAAQERYYYFAVPKNAQHPNAAKLYTLFLLTEEGQKLSYDTWKIDLHTMPGSHMGKMVDDFAKQNVKFKEVTAEWYLQHPEIDAAKERIDQNHHDQELMPLAIPSIGLILGVAWSAGSGHERAGLHPLSMTSTSCRSACFSSS